MSDYVCLLVTILNIDVLLKCAIRIKHEQITGDVLEYPMEPENRLQIHALLPEHVKSCGPIVNVEEIFEVHV